MEFVGIVICKHFACNPCRHLLCLGALGINMADIVAWTIRQNISVTIRRYSITGRIDHRTEDRMYPHQFPWHSSQTWATASSVSFLDSLWSGVGDALQTRLPHDLAANGICHKQYCAKSQQFSYCERTAVGIAGRPHFFFLLPFSPLLPCLGLTTFLPLF